MLLVLLVLLLLLIVMAGGRYHERVLAGYAEARNHQPGV